MLPGRIYSFFMFSYMSRSTFLCQSMGSSVFCLGILSPPSHVLVDHLAQQYVYNIPVVIKFDSLATQLTFLS